MAQEAPSPGSVWNGPPPRPATYEARMLFDLRIPMRDGVTLSADITGPRAEGRYPALVVRTPYNKNNITQN